MRHVPRILASACLLLCVLPRCHTAPADTTAPARLTQLLAKLPGKNAAEGQQICTEILALAPDITDTLCRQLRSTKDGGDTSARYALTGVAGLIAAGQASAHRTSFLKAVRQALQRDTATEVKAFLIRRLIRTGDDDVVPCLAGLLSDPDLGVPASRALTAIRTAAAQQALAQALAGSTGKPRIAIIQALGTLRIPTQLSAVLEAAESADPQLRTAALDALANIGDPAAIEALRAALDTPSFRERSTAASRLLLFARRLESPRVPAQGLKLCRELLADSRSTARAHTACAALHTLAELVGEAALPDLLTAAVDDERSDVRAAALELLKSLPGKDVTGKCVGALTRARPDVQAKLLLMLAERGDQSAMPHIRKAFTSENRDVRLAAIRAVTVLSGPDAVPDLLAALKTTDRDAIAAVKASLMRTPGNTVVPAVAHALRAVSPASRAMLLEFLATRRAADQVGPVFSGAHDTDARVRIAALKALGRLAPVADLPRLIALLLNAESAAEQKAARLAVASVAKRISDHGKRAAPVLEGLDGASPDQRARLLLAAATIGGDAALEVAVKEMASADAQRRDAAVRALAGWRDASACEPLLLIARDAADLTHRVLALRGCSRILAADTQVWPDRKAELLGEVLALAERPDEQRVALSSLATVHTHDALELAAGMLDSSAVAAEAALAVAAIACPNTKSTPGLRGRRVRDVLKRALDLLPNTTSRDRVTAYLTQMPKPEVLNVARGRPVKTSVRHQNTQVPALAVDGNASERYKSAWFGDRYPCWLQVDLQGNTELDAAHVFFYWDGKRYYQYTIDVSLDEKTWQTVVDAKDNTAVSTPKGVMHRFPPTRAQYARIHILKNSSNPAVHLVEFKVYASHTATSPDALNLAVGRRVSTSVRQQADRVPERAVDGNALDLNGSAWHGERWPCWLKVDLAEPLTVGAVRPVFYWDGARHYQYTIDVSVDGKSWQTVVDLSTNTTPSTFRAPLHQFEATTARYVRLNILKNSVNPAVHLVEFEVYAPGRTPPSHPMLDLPPGPDGWAPLFNGRDLTGWVGSTAGYAVEGGNLVCLETGGSLYTEATFSDFAFEFEFKVPPGGNNGVGIRVPMGAGASSGGMEIQILDNSAQQYAKLKPSQYHGSIYGVVPAKRGHLKPPGEWNKETIVADGRRVKVVLNGTMIVDADIGEAADKREKAGKPRPGLRRASGHICFCGHASRVEFRNLRIKDLSQKQTKPEG